MRLFSFAIAAGLAFSAHASTIDAQILQVKNVTSEVVRESITISYDGILSFDVKTSLPKGEAINVKLQIGFLQMDNTGTNFDDFQFDPWGGGLSSTVGPGGIAHFQTSVFKVKGPAYLKIIPQYFSGGNPPIITSFNGEGPIPCAPGRCRSRLPDMES